MHKTKHLSASIDIEVYEAIEKLMVTDDRKRSNVVNRLLKEALKAREMSKE